MYLIFPDRLLFFSVTIAVTKSLRKDVHEIPQIFADLGNLQNLWIISDNLYYIQP
jgi:hypothetical protein